MQKHESSTPTKSGKSPVIITILLIIVVVQGIFNTYLLTGNSFVLPTSIGVDVIGLKRALLELEYEKVGGKENYDLVNQATLIQMKEQIPQIREFIKANGGSQNPDANKNLDTYQIMDATQVEKIISSAVLEGNSQADIVLVEYSDMECPYCIRQYADTKLRQSLVTQYGETVAFAFKNNRGVNHSGTEPKAIASLCAKKVGGNEAYIKLYQSIMDATSQEALFPVSNLVELAKTIGLDMPKWQSCYDSKETMDQLLSETQEAQSLGLNGTPGTLILNRKTGKYTTVEGAYPFTHFTQKINSLMQ